MSSPTENAETKEESSTTISKDEESRGWEKEKASWLPSSSESDSGSEVDDSADGDNKNSQVWEIPLENVNLADKEEKEDYAMLPQIQQALEIMLNSTAIIPITNAAESVADVKPTNQTPSVPEVGILGVREGTQGLGVGEHVIPKNSVEPPKYWSA